MAVATIAGIEFEARGRGEVLVGVVGPEPAHDHPQLSPPIGQPALSDLPLHRWDGHPSGDAPEFVLDDPPIYLGTTVLGLHAALIGVHDSDQERTAVCILAWIDDVPGASLHYHWPTVKDSPSVGWSVLEGDPANSVMHWFPLPVATACVEFAVDGVVVESVRPTSRVALLHSVPVDAENRHLFGVAYNSEGAPLLTTRPHP